MKASDLTTEARAAWKILNWLLPLVLLQGLLYLTLLPPWQHYDEPGHFEYARLLAVLGAPATEMATKVPPAIRRELAVSMQRFNFWKPEVSPDLRSDSLPSIGFDQRQHPPLYYALNAAAVRATLALPVESQLYTARLISVLLYTLAVATAWRLAQVFAPDEPAFQLAVPLIYAAVPPFAAIMSAVNNDVLINFTGVILLLGCVLLVRDGLRPLPLVLALLSLLVAVMAKRTALIGALPLAMALVWAVVRKRQNPIWLVLALLVVSAIVAGTTLRLDVTSGTTALAIRPWVMELDDRYLHFYLDATVHSLADLPNSLPTYAQLAEVIPLTYWATLAWGHVRIGQGWYLLIMALLALAGSGLLLAAWRPENLPLWRRRTIWLFFATLLVGLIAVSVRVHPLPPYANHSYIPHGRYLFGGLAGMVILLLFGLQRLAPIHRRPLVALGTTACFMLINFAGLAAVISYYYGMPWPLTVLAAQKPGLPGWPPFYLVLLTLYLLALIRAARQFIVVVLQPVDAA